MNVFNSLGSNYSPGFALSGLFKRGSSRKTDLVKDEIGKYYGGRVHLTYKGRDALESAIRLAKLPPGSGVAINGFTCYVAYQAIRNAEHQPVMVDVAPGKLDFDLKQLKAAHKENPDLKAVIIQNTLGLPVDMTRIKHYCEKHGFIMIEDLAHSLGTVYPDGREAGTIGDLVMLSFSQDKPLDLVAGGALVDRRKNAPDYEDLPRVGLGQSVINRTYPMWTGLIRLTYPLGLGRVIHAGLKRLNWLATPMSSNIHGLHAMTGMGKGLLPDLWHNRKEILDHRRSIAKIYQKELPKAIRYEVERGVASYLRFPIHVKNRAGLIAHLKTRGVYVGDTWYDAPIAPKRFLKKSDYKTGQAPNSESLSEEIVNLPTHRHVTPKKAEFIAERVKEWLQ